MILASICAAIVLFVITATCLLAPTRGQIGWQDDTDCSRIALHTVRVLSADERLAMWVTRSWLVRDLGNPSDHPRLSYAYNLFIRNCTRSTAP